MILALINKGQGVYGQGGSALAATDFMVFGGATSTGGTAETDPTVASHIKNITAAQITQWNTAYGWGNHSGLYRPISWLPNWSDVQNKPLFTRTIPGLVPASGGSGTDRFLREDGNWAVPTGTGGTGDSTPAHVNQITQTQINNWDTAFGWGNHAAVGYTTQTSSDNRYIRKRDGLISTVGATRTWESATDTALGVSTNSTGSTGFPTSFGITYSFIWGQNGINDNGQRGRDFDLWKQNGADKFAVRGYALSNGNPNGWRWLTTSTSISQIWIGTSAQLPATRFDDILYFVTD